MSPEWAGIIGGLIGGVGALVAAWLAVELAMRRLKEQELRKLQVASVIELFALRAAMHDTASSELRKEFAREENKIGVLFATNPSIFELWKLSKSAQTNDAWIDFMRAASKEAGIDLGYLTNSEIDQITLEHR